MNRAPKRTGRTPLSDAELYLFDALFDAADRVGYLRREEYATAHNLPYTHDLDTAALSEVIASLERAGLVRLRATAGRPDLGPWVRLTPAGGVLWELERSPDWSRFCMDSSAPEGPGGRWVLRIRAADATVVEAFLETAVKCGLYVVESSRGIRRQVRARLVPWQPPRQLAELKAPLEPEPALRHCDWPSYEARRSWWRSIRELATLVA